MYIFMLQHTPVDGTAFVGDRLASLWWEAALEPDGFGHMCLWISGFKSLCLLWSCAEHSLDSDSCVFSVILLFHSLACICLLFALVFSAECMGKGVVNTPALENYSEWEHVFYPFASCLRLRYGSPGGKMDYIPACSILRIDKQGTYRSLAPILLLPDMYLMLIHLFSSFLSWMPVKGRESEADHLVMKVQAGSQKLFKLPLESASWGGGITLQQSWEWLGLAEFSV